MFLNRSLSSAVSINPSAAGLNIADWVPTTSPIDAYRAYRFSAAQPMSLNLRASSLSGDVNVAVIQDKNANGVVNADEILAQSANTGLTAESLKIATLKPGTYFVLVEAAAGTTAANYQLDLGATKSTVADILWRDQGRNELGYWRFDGLQFMDSRVINNQLGADWQFEAIGDFDGDRAEDILWRNKQSQSVVVWLMDPETGTFKPSPASGLVTPIAGLTANSPDGKHMVTLPSFQVAGVGDMDGDGKGDIIWRNEDLGSAVVWYMDGAKYKGSGVVGFRNAQTGVISQFSVDRKWELVDAGRVNDDQSADLVWRNRTSGMVVTWMMNGHEIIQGQAGAVTNTPLGANYEIETIGDLNGDGRSDLFWRDQTGQSQIWLTQAGSNKSYDVQTLKVQQAAGITTLASVPRSDWQLIGIDDFSGDGKADIAWRNLVSGSLVIWNMDGAVVKQESSLNVTNASVTNLAQKAVGTAAKADYVDFAAVTLSGLSDSGVSQNDWITNVRRPELSGYADVGSTVNVLANDRLIAQTTASATGAWSVVTSSLDDGVYKLTTEVRTVGGGVIKQNVTRSIYWIVEYPKQHPAFSKSPSRADHQLPQQQVTLELPQEIPQFVAPDS
ncbi:MAG: hypothetical protein RLZZ511_2400 [Cyanobacteriota bacterium]|jgi:hypothetical protein